MLSVHKNRSKSENEEKFDHIFSPLKNLEKNFGESLILENHFDSIGAWEPSSSHFSNLLVRNCGQSVNKSPVHFEHKLPVNSHPITCLDDIPRVYKKSGEKQPQVFPIHTTFLFF